MRCINSVQRPHDSCENIINEIPRFCYRSRFQAINPGEITSDKGWGCCYRSSQGLLAQYILHLKEMSPSTYSKVFEQDTDPFSLFFDIPTAPFGIQNLVYHAFGVGIEIGEWAKPSAIAACVKNITLELGLSCITSKDFMIDSTELSTLEFPALLLIPGLFGLDSIEQRFIPFLQLCLCTDGSLGFVSGHRNSAYYICGFDYNNFCYYDPHTTKNAVTGPPYNFHELPLHRIKLDSINPSVLLGFVCHSRDKLNEILDILTSCSGSPITVTNIAQLEEITNTVLDLDDNGNPAE